MICQECKKEVELSEKHTYEDCMAFINRDEFKTDEELFKIAKLFGDNYTYGEIIRQLKSLFNEHKEYLKLRSKKLENSRGQNEKKWRSM